MSKSLSFLAVFSVFLIFSSCGKHKNQNEKRTVFKYNESAGISSLDPAFAKDQSNIWAINQIYNGLVQLDDSLNIEPCIAKSWVISDSGITYTFTLRKDVYFHDLEMFKNIKRRVVASDFVYSFNRILDEKVASPGAWVLNNVKKTTNRFEFNALNDTTLIINLNEPFPPFLGLLSMQYCSVVPREVVEFYGKDFRKHPVGTGPFKLKLWKEDVKLVLTKNENYFEFDGKTRLPYLDAVSISFIKDKQSAFLEFIKGNLDYIWGIDPSYKDELLTPSGKLNPKYASKVKMLSNPYLNTEYLGFLVDENLPIVKKSPTRLKLIRQAINMGIDRRKMIKYLRNNVGTPGVSGFVPMGIPSFDSSIVKGYEYSPLISKALLTEAGFPNGNGLPPITLSTTATYLDLCKFIQQQLNEIGFQIKIDVNPPASLRSMIAKSEVTFFRGSWIADYPDAENYLSLFYSKNFAPKGPNYTHFKNAGYDSLFEKARSEVNDSIRFEYYRAMDKIIVNEAVVIVLYYDKALRFTQNNILDLGTNPMNLLTLKRVKKKNSLK